MMQLASVNVGWLVGFGCSGHTRISSMVSLAKQELASWASSGHCLLVFNLVMQFLKPFLPGSFSETILC